MCLTLRVITPERIALDTEVSSVVFPAVDGLMGVLPRHAPMVAALDSGALEYKISGSTQSMFVAGGFAEVRDDTVRIVTPAGEDVAEIDEERALAAEKRARERLKLHKAEDGEPVDILRAQASLRRAMLRVRTHRTHR